MTRALIVVVAACRATDPEPMTPAPPHPTPHPAPAAKTLSLEWSMRVEGYQLRIDYTVKNATDARVTVVDALPVHRAFDHEAIVVRGDTTPDAIAFTRAFVMPESGVKAEIYGAPPLPHYRDILAGETLTGTAHTELPLGASRNYSSAHAIYGNRPNAVLEIEYYDYPDVDASNAQGAWHAHPRKLLRGTPTRLPRGATLASPEEQAARSPTVMLGCPSPCPEPQAPLEPPGKH